VTRRPSRCFLPLSFLLIFTAGISGQESKPGDPILPLPSSKILTVPVPGRIGDTNSFPATVALSPDGRYAALLNDGYGTQEDEAGQSIALLDLQTNRIADFPDPRVGHEAHQSYFLGLAFSSSGTHLYASVGSLTDPMGEKEGDTGNGIAVYRFLAGKVTPESFITISPRPVPASKIISAGLRTGPPQTAIPYPAGIAVIPDSGHDKLLVADNLSDDVVLLDPATGKILQTFVLSTNDLIPSSFPYTVVATRDGRRAWCSLWNASQVAELDLTSGQVVRWIKLREPADPIAPGSHPTAMLLSPNERTLYVALSNVDQVAAVATDTGLPFAFLRAALGGDKFGGAYPSALAQTADGKKLFVADSSLDAIAVLDTTTLSNGPAPDTADFGPVGFIPTDWYPSALAVEGDDLIVATAKGQGARANNGLGKAPWEVKHHEHPYLPTLIRGSIARLNIPETIARLPELTRMVEHDNLIHADPGAFAFAQGSNPIKHVIYILKENRTYDQIFGDLKVGDGDPSLTMYGADITPNQHKLALQFGVLDNFYDSGEVSGDGHLWSTAAITSDYNEKTWQITYRGKERTYDYGGSVADEYPLTHGEADIDDPSTGYLWDNVARNGLTYRDYGEFISADWCNKKRKAATPKQGTPSWAAAACPRTDVSKGELLPENIGSPHGGASPWPWPVPLFKQMNATKAVLRDHFDPLFPDFNTEYPDQLRADEFLNEFSAFVRARKGDLGAQLELPAFVLLYLPDDHTGGTRSNYPRPASSVADNDLAVGRVVDAVSHSPYWDDTAILILEDDAQDGADHVDAHRSTALVISKYSPGSPAQPYVEHHFYTTVNMIHTLEMLLGLPPMNQNDAHAPVMSRLFSGAGNQPAFAADYRNRDNRLIYEINKPHAPGAKMSSKMDFSRPDANQATKLNRVLWRDQKGKTPMPKPKHTVFPAGDDD
jgi:DNA-binding beta-propeller fold protein YncE